MQIVTLSGKICGPCEQRKDKNGNGYIRFRVTCASKDATGGNKFTTYRCYSYDTSFNNLQNGDIVFLTGDLNIITKTDENGKTWMNVDVYIKSIDRG